MDRLYHTPTPDSKVLAGRGSVPIQMFFTSTEPPESGLRRDERDWDNSPYRITAFRRTPATCAGINRLHCNVTRGRAYPFCVSDSLGLAGYPVRMGIYGISGLRESRSFPPISGHLSREGMDSAGGMGAASAVCGTVFIVLAGRWEDLEEGRLRAGPGTCALGGRRDGERVMSRNGGGARSFGDDIHGFGGQIGGFGGDTHGLRGQLDDLGKGACGL